MPFFFRLCAFILLPWSYGLGRWGHLAGCHSTSCLSLLASRMLFSDDFRIFLSLSDVIAFCMHSALASLNK